MTDKKAYSDMTAEELELRLRETFFYPDQIDDTVFRELEEIREALEAKRPVRYAHTAQDSWARFAADHAEELDRLAPKDVPEERGHARQARPRSLLRRVLLAAVVVVLLAGAALAADSLGLRAWVLRWNASTGRYVPVSLEAEDLKPIPAALAELGITEPVYPARLPEGFVITESHISEDPLILAEQYARGDRRLSITVTPIAGIRNTVYQKDGTAVREYRDGAAVHYVFESEMTITAIWYTDHYATFVSGNLTLAEIRGIMGSLGEASP